MHPGSAPETAPPAARDPVAQCARLVEAALRQRLASLEMPEALRDGVGYALISGGKMLRPALTLLCCEVAGGDRRDAIPAAVGVEFVHTFSLVHDDLPAMDDDALRRGRPTLHVRSGEAMAILAGDAMLAAAFGVIGREVEDPERARALVVELADASGRMITGQVYDTLGGRELERAPDAASHLELIHRNKTGALLRAACRMGGICAGADGETLDAITRFGERIGLMYQIVDDLLDVEQTSEHLGKRAGKDADAGKATYPSLLGVGRSREEVERLGREAEEALAPLGAAAGPLREVCAALAVRTR